MQYCGSSIANISSSAAFVKSELDFTSDYISSYFYVWQQNAHLIEQNHALRSSVIILQKELGEIKEFKKLIEFHIKNQSKHKFIIGRISYIGINDQMIFYIEKGSLDNDKIQIGDLVFSADGIIGRISEIHDKFCKIIPTTSKEFKIRARGFSTQSYGILSGNGDGKMVLIPRSTDDKFSLGEIIIISGVSDIMIGKVTKIHSDMGSENMFLEYEVEPSAKNYRIGMIYVDRIHGEEK